MESNSETVADGNVALVEDASSSLVNVTEDDIQMTINSERLMNKKHEMEAEKEDIMKYNDDSVYTEHLKMFLTQSETDPQSFSSQVHIEKHPKLNHGKKDMKCSICNKNFKLQSRFDLHLRKFHTNVRHHCSYCKFESATKKELLDHNSEKQHEDPSTFQGKCVKRCDECQKEFKSYKTLTKHITAHHAKNSKFSKLFTCVDCGFKAPHQKELKKHNAEVHEKLLTKEDVRSCPLCEYQTEWGKSHLDRHIRTIHDKIKDFHCPFCEVSCSQKGNLRLHIDQVHKNIRKFSCTQCNYKSNFRNDIAKHNKSVHEKVKDIACTSCSFTTTLKSYLSIHMKTVHGKSRKEHLCTHCGKQFRVFRNLFNHIKVLHPFEQLPENPRRKKNNSGSRNIIEKDTKDLTWKERQDLVFKMKQPAKRVINGKTYHRVSCSENGCDYTTLWGKNHLKKHIKAVHQKVKDINCTKCEYIACQNIHMSTHLRLVHLTCHQCGKQFWDNMDSMASSCQHCSIRFPLRRHLVRHMKAVHPDKPLPCKVIRVDGKSLRLSNEIEFEKEFGTAHENVNRRNCYNENLQNLRKHIKLEHPIFKKDPNLKDQQCPDCDYKTTDRCHLNEHIKAVHKKIKDFLCEQCSYATSRKSNLIKHINNQHVGNPEERVKMLSCPKCSDRFPGQVKLNEHVANTHPEVKRLSCHLCTFQTKDSSHLKRHIKAIHDKVKDHKCPHCEDVFSDKSNLLKHIKAVHLKLKNINHKPKSKQTATFSKTTNAPAISITGYNQIRNDISSQREQSCLQCRFQTNSEELMDKHVKEEHEKIKNIACQQCSYATWTNYNLDRHVKRCHERKIKDKDLNIKDLQCDQCDYKTALSDRLAKHVKEVHEMTKDFSCNFCKYQTKRKSNLDAHMQRVHEKNKKTTKNHVISQEILTTALPFSVIPSTTTEIITVPVVQQEVHIHTMGKWEQPPTIVYQHQQQPEHSYFITEQI